MLNELEFIDGLVYANIYTKNLIAVIDPKNGKVMAIIDATELVKRGKGTANGEVLNGIAYNSANRKTYMTGKFWPKLFEIEVLKTTVKGL
jgi:glutaminyl-peptide cyclotransferase